MYTFTHSVGFFTFFKKLFLNWNEILTFRSITLTENGLPRKPKSAKGDGSAHQLDLPLPTEQVSGSDLDLRASQHSHRRKNHRRFLVFYNRKTEMFSNSDVSLRASMSTWTWSWTMPSKSTWKRTHDQAWVTDRSIGNWLSPVRITALFSIQGRILLKGDNITLIQQVVEKEVAAK